ncbi:MAG: phage tail tape measure protein, partial [Acidimicrobiales bacterium]
MALEQALGIRLTLVAQVGNAAREVRGELNGIADSLKVISDLGKQFTLDGLTQLNKEVTSLNQRASAAAKNVAILSQNLKEAEAAGNAAAAGVNASAGAADRVRTAASGAAQSVIRMGEALSRTQAQGNALAVLRTDFVLVEGAASAATTEVNAFADAVLRLSGAQRLALSGGPAAYASRYAYGTPAFVPLPGGAQYALPSGDGPRYAPIPQPASMAALTGAEMLALTGGTEPNFNARAWWANQRAQGTSADSGEPIGVPPGGFGGGGGGGGFWSGLGGFFGGGGGGMKKFGDQVQSQGWGLAVNGGMLAALLVPAGKSAMDLQDLLDRTVSAMRESPAVAKAFNDNLMKSAIEVGTPLRDSIHGGYTFVSSLPHGFDLSTKAGQQAANAMYNNILKLALAGGSSAAPFTPSEAAFDVNTAFVQHFDLSHASDPKKMLADYKKIADAFINVENTTSTTVPMIGQSLKALGPLAEQMGMSFEQSMTLIAALAQGGVRGSSAGYAGKRLLSKQAAPAKKLQQVEDSLAARGFNVSMWDGGNPQDFYKFIENVGNAEQHMSKQSSAYVNQELSGLYAISQFDQLVNFVHKNGGAKGMEAYGKALTQPGALDRAYAKRTHDNVKVQATKAESAIQTASLEALV